MVRILVSINGQFEFNYVLDFLSGLHDFFGFYPWKFWSNLTMWYFSVGLTPPRRWSSRELYVGDNHMAYYPLWDKWSCRQSNGCNSRWERCEKPKSSRKKIMIWSCVFGASLFFRCCFLFSINLFASLRSRLTSKNNISLYCESTTLENIGPQVVFGVQMPFQFRCLDV